MLDACLLRFDCMVGWPFEWAGRRRAESLQNGVKEASGVYKAGRRLFGSKEAARNAATPSSASPAAYNSTKVTRPASLDLLFIRLLISALCPFAPDNSSSSPNNPTPDNYWSPYNHPHYSHALY